MHKINARTKTKNIHELIGHECDFFLSRCSVVLRQVRKHYRNTSFALQSVSFCLAALQSFFLAISNTAIFTYIQMYWNRLIIQYFVSTSIFFWGITESIVIIQKANHEIDMLPHSCNGSRMIQLSSTSCMEAHWA